MTTKFWHERTIDDLELSHRTSRIISAWRPGITLGELAWMPGRKLLALPQFGRRSLNELRDAIRYEREMDTRFQATAEAEKIAAWVEENRGTIMAIIKGEMAIVQVSRFPLETDDGE